MKLDYIVILWLLEAGGIFYFYTLYVGRVFTYFKGPHKEADKVSCLQIPLFVSELRDLVGELKG